MDLMNAQEDPKRKALLSLMGGTADGSQQTPGQPGAELPMPSVNQAEGDPNQGEVPPGVVGPPEPFAPAAPEGPTGPPQTNDFGRVMGYDEGKFKDPNKHDFKYDTARVLSRFDPRQGFTPDVINALNSELGATYGDFSGEGDKLSLKNARGAKDAADFANQDWIYAHKANNDATKWNFGGGGAAGGGGDVPNGIVPGTGGDMSGAALQPILNEGVPTDNGFFEKLLAQARGIAGPASTDRQALLSLMK